jgi:hypothetical protein
MGLSTSVLTAVDTTPRPASAVLATLLRALDEMVASAEPAEVFTSAARVCVPLICSSATVTITGADQEPSTITCSSNWPDQAGPAPTTTVCTVIVGEPTEKHEGYAGTLTLEFHSLPAAEHAVLAQLVVDRATALVHRQRLVSLLDVVTARAVNLEIALASNREIGIAIGVLMSLGKVTREHAFDLLRDVSQCTNRKLRDIALDVIETGTIGPLAHRRSPTPAGAGYVAGGRSRNHFSARCVSSPA